MYNPIISMIADIMNSNLLKHNLNKTKVVHKNISQGYHKVSVKI